MSILCRRLTWGQVRLHDDGYICVSIVGVRYLGSVAVVIGEVGGDLGAMLQNFFGRIFKYRKV